MRRVLVALLAAAIAAVWACVAVPASAATQTIVTIGFDDTNLDQYTAARSSSPTACMRPSSSTAASPTPPTT